MNRSELQRHARTAQDQWLFDEDTDPDGIVAQGLANIIADEVTIDQDQIDEFIDNTDPDSNEFWDKLDSMARYFGE